MKDDTLEALVASGTIKSYSYEEIPPYNIFDGNEKVILTFKDGNKLMIESGNGNYKSYLIFD